MSGLHYTNFGDTSRLRNLPTVVRLADDRALIHFSIGSLDRSQAAQFSFLFLIASYLYHALTAAKAAIAAVSIVV